MSVVRGVRSVTKGTLGVETRQDFQVFSYWQCPPYKLSSSGKYSGSRMTCFEKGQVMGKMSLFSPVFLEASNREF